MGCITDDSSDEISAKPYIVELEVKTIFHIVFGCQLEDIDCGKECVLDINLYIILSLRDARICSKIIDGIIFMSL